jgi:hypothetical protein
MLSMSFLSGPPVPVPSLDLLNIATTSTQGFSDEDPGHLLNIDSPPPFMTVSPDLSV